MKKCPTCGKTFEDSMRFCQVDGTTLIDDAPAFDPYATMVSTPASSLKAEEEKAEPVHGTVGSVPISPPDDVLDLPEADPLKTMYASDDEMKAILAEVKGEIIDVPPIGEEPKADSTPEPEAPTFTEPELPSPSFGESSPPPSPFSSPESKFAEPAPAPPVFADPPSPTFPEENIMNQGSNPTDWAPPPAPNAAWQNDPVGSNTPFQPPPAGVSGQNQTLAIVSMVLGILGLTICCGTLIPSLAALITGIMAKSKAGKNPQEYGGAGFALAGIITGAVGFVGGIVVLILFLLPYVFYFIATL